MKTRARLLSFLLGRVRHPLGACSPTPAVHWRWMRLPPAFCARPSPAAARIVRGTGRCSHRAPGVAPPLLLLLLLLRRLLRRRRRGVLLLLLLLSLLLRELPLDATQTLGVGDLALDVLAHDIREVKLFLHLLVVNNLRRLPAGDELGNLLDHPRPLLGGEHVVEEPRDAVGVERVGVRGEPVLSGANHRHRRDVGGGHLKRGREGPLRHRVDDDELHRPVALVVRGSLHDGGPKFGIVVVLGHEGDDADPRAAALAVELG
mmetsp:Transcript_9180/g.41790  ORF Transcript_9180/g.41790 Transcript_9180/m.41790 type:complete len:261 (+) Transcript_9180:2609-3391(+)